MTNLPPPPPPPPPGYGPPGPPQWGPPTAPNVAYPGYPGYPGYRPPYSGFWMRFAGAFIDGLVLSPFFIVGRIVLANGPTKTEVCTLGQNLNSVQLCRVPTATTWAIWGAITLAGVVAGVLYAGILEGKYGQTLGKRAVGIKVVDAQTGGLIGVGRAVGRHFAKFLSAIPCGLGYFWMLWDPNRQCWHDKIVNDYVIIK